MARGLLLVLSNPTVPGIGDEEFNTWYDTVHLPEVLARTPFVSARRFKVADRQLRSQGGSSGVTARFGYSYVALYEVEADDLEAAVAGLERVSADLATSTAMDYGSTCAVALELIHASER